METHALRLLIRANTTAFEPQRIEYQRAALPTDTAPTGDVPKSVIGCWVEIFDRRERILYRRFIHYLPHNLKGIWPEWSSRQRAQAAYWLTLPLLKKAHCVALFEQRLPSAQHRAPERYCHFNLVINHKQLKPNMAQKLSA